MAQTDLINEGMLADYHDELMKTHIAGGCVFDISAYHATGEPPVLATYADLAAALDSNNGGGVPPSLQEGGMSVKFVRSSDNKYVQYRFLLSTFNATQFANTNNWINEDFTAPINELKSNFDYYTLPYGIRKDNGSEISAATLSRTTFISIVPNHNIIINGAIDNSIYTCCAFYNENKEFISCYEPSESRNNIYVNIPYSSVPQNAKYFRSCALTATENKYIMHGEIVNYDERIINVENQLQEEQEVIDSLSAELLPIFDDVINVPANQYVTKAYPYAGTYYIKLIRKDIPEQTGYAAIWSSDNGGTLGQLLGYILPDKEIRLTNNSPYIIFRFGKYAAANSYEVQIRNYNNIPISLNNISKQLDYENIIDNIVYVTTGRLQKYFSCHGVVRVKLEEYSGTAVTLYRLYYSKSGVLEKLASKPTQIGNYIETRIPEDCDGIFVYTVETQSSDCAYRITIDKLDTEYAKSKHNERILIFGDSITQFNGQSAGINALYPALRYSDWMQVYRPGINVTNVGIGGTRLSQRTTPSLPVDGDLKAFANLDIVNMVSALCDNDFSYQDASITYLNSKATPNHNADVPVATLKEVDLSKIDIVIIEGGTNDYASGSSVGDAGSVDKGTIIGAINTIVSKLLTANPNLKIYFITPPVGYASDTHTDAYWKDNVQNSQGKTLVDICNVIEDTAGKLYIPVFDMHFDFGWNQLNFEHYFPIDNTHPYNGFDYIGKKLIKYLFGLE